LLYILDQSVLLTPLYPFPFNTHLRYPCFFIFNICELSFHVLIFIVLYFLFMFTVVGHFQQKRSAVLLVSYLHGWVGGRGTFLILCFAMGFVLSFLYWEKLLGSLFFMGYIFYGPVFIGFCYWEKSFCIQGGISSSRMLGLSGGIIYWI